MAAVLEIYIQHTAVRTLPPDNQNKFKITGGGGVASPNHRPSTKLTSRRVTNHSPLRTIAAPICEAAAVPIARIQRAPWTLQVALLAPPARIADAGGFGGRGYAGGGGGGD